MTDRIVVAVALVCLASGIAVAQTPNEWILRAAKAREDGDVDKALEFAGKAIAADPKAKLGYLFRAALRESHPGTDRIAALSEALADYTAVLKIDPKDVDALQSRGCVNFKLGKFDASVADFDAFLAERPEARKQHWQRGISLYYAGKYDDGAKQFAAYQDHDSNDVENAVWCFLCMAKSLGIPKARAAMLKIGDDRRVPMRQVYELFMGKLTPEDVLAAAAMAPNAKTKTGQLFYAHLYLGLWYDATGDRTKALQELDAAALETAPSSYMGDTALVHRDFLRAKDAKK
jgi:lipoprotein NlpI